MPQHKSAKKRVITNEKSRVRNAAIRSTVKTTTKAFVEAADAGDKDKAASLMKEAVKQVDKAASKGVLHKKTAANRKSSIMRKAAGIGV